MLELCDPTVGFRRIVPDDGDLFAAMARALVADRLTLTEQAYFRCDKASYRLMEEQAGPSKLIPGEVWGPSFRNIPIMVVYDGEPDAG